MRIEPSIYSRQTAQLARAREKAKDIEEDYKRFSEYLEANTETEAERQKRIAAEKKLAQQKRQKTKRLMQLDGRISYLHSRIMANPDDKVARGELAMAKCQRYWVMHGS